MCGIGGIVQLTNEEIDPDLIQKYHTVISHRGPDSHGTYSYQHLALLHRRLSIIDLSPNGHQPMPYGADLSIVFNGEIYNYLEIKEVLINAGYTFHSESDTEVIMAAYLHWGEACVEQFNGMWAFALLDKANQKLFCSRDRFGVKPFYYRQSKSFFAFASEIKQFTTLPDWKATLHLERAIDFINYGIFDHTDETLFKGVNQLKPGNNLVFNLKDNSFIIHEWYNLRKRVKKYEASFDQAKEEFYTLFTDAVKLRLRSDVKVGSCLSGGIDSTSIVCSINQLLKKENKQGVQETVSACSTVKKYDEQQFIDAVIKNTEIKPHKVYPNLDGLFDLLDELIWHQDEPFTSTSTLAQWSVFAEAKKNDITVMLDGQGADESLAGYLPFHDAHLIGMLKAANIGGILSEVGALKKLKGYPAKKAWQFLFKFLLPSSISLKLRSHTLPFRLKTDTEKQSLYKPQFFGSIQEMSFDQLLCSNLPMLLHYEDRNSMAHSIESRVPFLDYRLVEFIVGLPDSYKIRDGQTKYILREALAHEIPAEIKNRHDKMGFLTSEAVWIQEHQEEFRSHLLKAVKEMEFLLDQEEVMDSFDNLVSGGKEISIGSVYFRILTLHRWMRVFQVNPS